MYAKNLASRAVSGICVLALALLLASCKTPIKQNYTVGGSVSGLAGTGLMLQNNGSGNLAIPGNGGFIFPQPLTKGETYSVTVRTQPPGQSCTVGNGTGTISGNVTNVAVNCGGNSVTIGVTVSGLAGTGLVLQNNGGDDLSVATDGAFSFATAVASGSAYSVTVLTQPGAPTQACTVTNGAGTASANVTNVAVNCVTRTYTVGGTVSNLAGAGLVLKNNGADDLPVVANGAFAFATPVASGSSYKVTVSTQPSGQSCAVANGSGSVASSDVMNVAVTCVAPPAAPTLSLGFGVKELRFSWSAVSGADFYRLLENPDGVSGYTQVGADLTALSFNHAIPVHRRLNASYVVEACNIVGCTPSAPQILGTSLAQAIGYFKASSSTNRINDQLGFTVALSGDGNTLAVGAPFEDSSTIGIDTVPNEAASNAGAAYVYTRSAGAWSQQAYVKASNSGANDFFGNSVALSADGNTLAVGAPGEASSTTGIGSLSNNSAPFAGAVYVFTRSGGAWSEQAYVKASNTGSSDSFGNSVALSADGNTLAVGTPFESSNATGIDGNQADNSALMAGAAYVFTRSAGAWSQQAYVKASNTAANDQFGWSVALSGEGNTLAVGANLEDSNATGINGVQTDNSLANAGAVYVFTRPSGGATWSQQAYVKASNTGTGDQFGYAVGLSSDGSTLVVGAPLEDSSSTGIDGTQGDSGISNNTGAAYVYARSGSNWSQQAYVKASNTGTGDQFGSSVALSSDGSTLAVGAILEDSGSSGIGSAPDDSAADAGAVYFYARSAGTWSQQAYVKASNTGAGDRFGISVALSGDGNTLAVGAQFEDSGSTGVSSTPNESVDSAGAVYLY